MQGLRVLPWRWMLGRRVLRGICAVDVDGGAFGVGVRWLWMVCEDITV